MAAIMILIPVLLSLLGTAIAVVSVSGQSAVANPGAHGFSEILYAFSSTSNNNGSAFAGYGSNVFINITESICMFIGRFLAANTDMDSGRQPGKKRRKYRSHQAPYRPITPLFCFLADCSGGHCRRIKLLPGTVVGTDRRVLKIKVEICRNYYFGKNRKQATNNQRHREPGAARRMYQRAIVDAFAKLDPRWMIHNPVMFVTEVGSVLTTVALGTSV